MAETAWRIYYDGGATYTGDPWLAPVFGVLIIVVRDRDHGFRLISNGDYYCWITKEETWRQVDYIGMVDYLQQPGPKRVLFGRMISTNAWNEAVKAAMNDPDFPPKTGFAQNEPRPR